MFVGLDESGLVHDFYYPYVGLENLTNARNCQHRVGIFVDNCFKWIDDGSFDISLNFEEEALISEIRVSSNDLEVELLFKDFIDINSNTFLRRIKVINNASNPREIRLFMHQIFQLSNLGRGDTALYVPDGHYILDYKGRYSLGIGGKFDDGKVSNYNLYGL